MPAMDILKSNKRTIKMALWAVAIACLAAWTNWITTGSVLP